MPSTKLLLSTADQLEVEGSIDEVVKALENAARSGSGTLAWLVESGTGERLGVNPPQVVTVRSGEL